jgi:hypothetical protein
MNSFAGFTQKELKIVPLFDGKPVTSYRTFWTSDSSYYSISTLRFYISHLKVNDAVHRAKVHLFDLEDSNTHILRIDTDAIHSVEFLLGTDSLTNVSGILDGPLDPILGMYWTWNSGYINFKIEGTSNRSLLPDKSFEYHIGGYLHPYTTSRNVKLVADESSKCVRIELRLDDWFNGLDVSTIPSVMIPGPQAAQLADQLVPAFKLGDEE